MLRRTFRKANLNSMVLFTSQKRGNYEDFFEKCFFRKIASKQLLKEAAVFYKENSLTVT